MDCEGGPGARAGRGAGGRGHGYGGGHHALDDDVQAADLLQEYEAKIAALERMVGRQALEIEFLTCHGVLTGGQTLLELFSKAPAPLASQRPPPPLGRARVMVLLAVKRLRYGRVVHQAHPPRARLPVTRLSRARTGRESAMCAARRH